MKTKSGINSMLIKQRRLGRILAFQALFAYDVDQTYLNDLLKFTWNDDNDLTATSTDYAKFLVEGTIRNLAEIDKLIAGKLRNWDLDRISSVDKAIVRFATFSLLYEDDLEKSIIIDEAVEINKQFGAKDSYKFVNGILDAIKKDKLKG